MICVVPDCSLCSGALCNACGNEPRPQNQCAHDTVERHSGMRAIEQDHPHESRVPTKPLAEPLLADRIDVNLADPASLAHFLEVWARIVRTRKSFSLILQPAVAPQTPGT